jgi:hypothetical protein
MMELFSYDTSHRFFSSGAAHLLVSGMMFQWHGGIDALALKRMDLMKVYPHPCFHMCIYTNF